MVAGIAWSAWAAWGLGDDYPKNTFLGPADYRFTDFTDETLAASLPNPYLDPISIYPPATFVFLRALPFPDSISLILLDFLSVAALALLLFRVLPAVVTDAWTRVALSFLFLLLSYPLLFCLDRGNIDIVAFPCVGWAIYFYRRHRDLEGTACLFPVICLKFYPAIFLFLLLRRGKAGLAVACGLGALATNAACLFFYSEPPASLWSAYQQNSKFFHDSFFLDTNGLENSASPWNAYRISLILLHKFGLIPRIDFAFDGLFIAASYQVYLALFALFSLLCLGYAVFHERNFTRCAIMLLLLVTLSLPSGPDYRMVYVSMAIVLLVLLRRRAGDMTALVLLALAVIPKKEIFLGLAGRELRYDVPIQSLLNPILILTAMAFLLYHARHPIDWQRAALRLRDLLPGRWRWL